MIGVYALIIIMYLTLPFLSTSFSLNFHRGFKGPNLVKSESYLSLHFDIIISKTMELVQKNLSNNLPDLTHYERQYKKSDPEEIVLEYRDIVIKRVFWHLQY